MGVLGVVGTLDMIVLGAARTPGRDNDCDAPISFY